MENENQEVHFGLYRYQLLPLTQHPQMDIFSSVLPEKISVEGLKARKNEIFQEVLEKFPPLQHRDVTLNHRINLAKPPWFVFEINTPKSLQRERKDFQIEKIDTWPHVVVVINNQPDTQLIAISRNQKAFSSGAVVARLLQENFQRALGAYLLSIQIEALFEKNQFWALVEKFSGKITSVKFELISPNMANISKALQLDLAKLNADTNSHRTELQLNSSEGAVLEINHENKLVDSLVEYSSQGGGDIEFRIKGLKKTIRTSKGVREVSVDQLAIKNVSPDRLLLLFDEIL